MTRRNRVTPLGELIADPARGLVYGNRGCLHDEAGRVRRAYAGKRWIACRLRFRGWHRSPLMRPGGFTELFFLDEATALAAGHRPRAPAGCGGSFGGKRGRRSRARPRPPSAFPRPPTTGLVRAEGRPASR